MTIHGDLTIHAIVSAYGPASFGLSSPQLPELFAGSSSLDEYDEDRIVALFREAGAPDEYQLCVHRQSYASREGREWFVRLFQDPRPEDAADRRETLRLLRGLLDTTPAPVDEARHAVTGEVLFIIACAEDTLGWLTEQLHDHDIATIVARPDDHALWMLDVASDENSAGATPDQPETTVGQLMEHRKTHSHVPAPDFLTETVPATVSRVGELISVGH